MKKRVVALLLTMAMCMTTVGEAVIVSAEEFTSEAAEFSDDLIEDEENVILDGSSIVTEPELEEDEISAEESAQDPEEEYVQDAEVSEDIEAEEPVSEAEAEEPDFTSGEEDIEAFVEFAADMQTAAIAVEASHEKSEGEGKSGQTASLYYTRWELDNTVSPAKWKLQKLEEAEVAEQSVVEEDTAETGESENAAALSLDDESALVEDAVDADPQEEAQDTDVQTYADVQTQEADTKQYYTSEDGLVEITTMDADGSTLFKAFYAFDADGYLITGRSKVDTGSSSDYYYFKTESEVSVTNSLSKETKTPFNSALGQMISSSWMWNTTDKAFNYYGSKGKQESFTANAVYKINGNCYFLPANGKPYTGEKYTTYNGNTGYYMFSSTADSNGIPGKMVLNAWASKSTTQGTQWRYYGSNGVYQKKGIGAYDLKSNNTLYFLDANGYLIKNKMRKAANGYYYLSNSYGVVYREKLVKYGSYRYYFVGDGRRATWKNRWVKCKGAGNRYYYFGSTAGRIKEQKGIKKVTVSGKFIGWFYFSSAGNSFLNAWKDGRYYLSDGRMASGVTKINGNYYFFRRSTSSSYKGKVYKSQWIKYNGKYYYASKNGILAESGWKRIKADGKYYYFYFQNCVALTNKSGMKRGSTYGILDSRGRFVKAGWFVYNNKKNYARYIDPSTGKIVKNTVKVINGVQYRFDKYGNRVNDRTSEFKQSSYYLECDRVNGVMTVYTSSNKKIPIKTIRVSVGAAGTETPLGTYKLKRSQRWQPLMGPSWGQYGTHVKGAGQGGIFVHSIACSEMNDHNLPVAEYLKLGNPASHGCIRCCVADAKWIYDNCNGSTIRIFDGTYKSDEALKGPLGRNPLTALRGNKTFDPTDPAYS